MSVEIIRFASSSIGRKRKQFAEGIIKVYRLPEDWTEEEYLHRWCHKGNMVGKAHISPQEKRYWLEAEFPNLIMTAGRTQVLTYIGASSGNTTGFAKYLALGTGSIQAPSPTDTALANEIFRKAQASNTVQGTQVDVSFSLVSGDANATITNAGLFGNTATGTLGSGTLYTHALFSYTKGAWAVSVDYIVNLL